MACGRDRERVKLGGAWSGAYPGQHLVDFQMKPVGVPLDGTSVRVQSWDRCFGRRVAGVLTWQPSGAAGRAAQGMAVAGKPRTEHAGPPYGHQNRVREDEPRNSCICHPQRMSLFSNPALALRAPRLRGRCAPWWEEAEDCGHEGFGPAPGQGPPWTWRTFSLPSQGQDRRGRLVDGWWVRHHVKPRKRPFHPTHKKTPPKRANGRR